MYEETHRIPLVISPSSKTQNASICEQFVSLVDLMPTFLELAGAKVPDHLDGQSLSPFLTS
ncbi:TPA: choline-sulfatase, partial [Candidatus Poribacteria bacterium]|nr:choline-sulfatase [Candidatus Poribacteria bacterium]